MVTYFQHRYGGIYEYIGDGVGKSREERVAVYRHLYPFDVDLYVRPLSEFFDGRFKQIHLEDVEAAMRIPRAEFQLTIGRVKSSADT